MLLPRSHAWTRTQKRLIISAAALLIATITATVWIYERYYRGPGEEILYGDWEAIDFLPGDTIYFRFRPDQTFTAGGVSEGQFNPFSDGRWYAGGPNIYIRFSADDIRAPQRVIVLHIVDVQPNEVHVRLVGGGQVYTFRRATLKSASASNQALERTADRREDLLSMTSTLKLEAQHTVVSGRSAWSR